MLSQKPKKDGQILIWAMGQHRSTEKARPRTLLRWKRRASQHLCEPANACLCILWGWGEREKRGKGTAGRHEKEGGILLSLMEIRGSKQGGMLVGREKRREGGRRKERKEGEEKEMYNPFPLYTLISGNYVERALSYLAVFFVSLRCLICPLLTGGKGIWRDIWT